MPPLIDLVGNQYGDLTVLRRDARVARKAVWTCRCACGAEVGILSDSLRKGRTRSCGCMRADNIAAAKRKHGHTTNNKTRRRASSKTYYVWMAAKARCENPNNKRYQGYGSRGIKMCERWSKDFSAFLADMGEQPEGMQIDRIDNDGNYEPGNCRWVTPKENRNNNGHIRFITAFGKTQTITAWAQEQKMPKGTIRSRLRLGWSPERALTEPPMIAGGRKGWRKHPKAEAA